VFRAESGELEKNIPLEWIRKVYRSSGVGGESGVDIGKRQRAKPWLK